MSRLATRPLGRIVSVLAGLSILAAACASGSAEPTSTTLPPPATTIPVPATCDGPTSLFNVAEALDGTNGTCRDWLDISYGRVVNGSTASATIWSTRTEHGTALVVGAMHTLGLGWFGPADTAVIESIVNPEDEVGVPRLFLVRADGSGTDSLASPWFRLYNPAVAADRNNNLLHDLLPREDFYVAAADSQKLDVSGLPPIPEPLVKAQVPIYDPAGATTADPSWANSEPGGLVLMLGYPNATGELTASVGRVLTDVEAQATVARLAELSDPEGSIPYDAEAEVIVHGEAVAGMSGGAMIDRDGRLVGILVRATDVHDGDQYVRAVRMSWVVSRLTAAFDALGPADQAIIGRYLESDG